MTFSQHHSRADSCRNAFSNTSEDNDTEKFTLSLAITTRPRRRPRTTPSQWSSSEPARGVATHRLISERGRLRGRHVVIGRLKRKLLHFLFLVEMNHLHRKQPRAQQGVMSSQNCTQQAGFRCRPPPPPPRPLPQVLDEVILAISLSLKHRSTHINSSASAL